MDSVIIEAHICPLCDKWAAGGVRRARYGGLETTCGWKFRLDLGGHAICPRCNVELGEDKKRLSLMDADGQREYRERYQFESKFIFLKARS